MARRPLVLALVATLTASAAAAWAPQTLSSFLGAPAGQTVSFQPVTLPPVAKSQLPSRSMWAPTTQEILNGNVVVRTEGQMETIWRRIYSVPFDASLFDFSQDFVLLMGGGLLGTPSFSITSVEEVQANWFELFFASSTDAFLAVTGTTILPGVAPPVPPPPTWRVSAVRVPQTLFDDVVFHRTVIALP